MDFQALEKIALSCGFSCVGPLDASTIVLRHEVRDMCAANRCRMYGKNWSCPPGCGDLEKCRADVARYKSGVLVQTVGHLEDEFDGETMMAAEKEHKESFARMYRELRKEYPGMLALGAGSCTRCKECTWPDAPCRFPEEMTSSMEAYGIMVYDICRDNGMKYSHGPLTIAYTSCFLLE
ncbi:MAG: DUF2284 domain-containing protein [Clostridia bacterium]|nr:DUF2284 domain-containing protein [Clostridia bacterium]